MIPEPKASLNHFNCNNSKVLMGVSGCPILHSANTDLTFSTKSYENDEKYYSPSKNNNSSFDADLMTFKPIQYNDEINSESDSNVCSGDKGNYDDGTSNGNLKRISCSLPSFVRKPAEVFRKDLISAMKIPDTAVLTGDDYWVMQDSWKIEWEKGVQVPVNYDAIPETFVQKSAKNVNQDFKLPRKMIRLKPKPGDKFAVDLNQLADAMCRYDLDELDVCWLAEINQQRLMMGMDILYEHTMERIMEALENQCYDQMHLAMQAKEGLGMQFDEDVVCDVCRQPDSEDDNEMVFCDGCNVCVHQACYGIVKIPEGSWLCKPCSLGVKETVECIFCGDKGGAMKSTRSGQTWAHVICALWIPEVSFGDATRMEPITKVSNIPPSRWSLLCSLCKERVGACIQCSVKQCVVAYHVTCAVEARLEMSTEFEGDVEDSDAVVFKSFCKKHSKNRKESSSGKANNKLERKPDVIGELDDVLLSFANPSAIQNTLQLPSETVNQVATYWRLKRKANFNKPLMVSKNEEGTSAAEAAETNLKRRLRLFTHIRQDLERVRNLCYMVCRREKLKSTGVKNMENVFLTQMKSLEYRMKLGYHTPRMVSLLQKSSEPDVCDVARRESTLLAKSHYWRRKEATLNSTKPLKPILKANKKRSPKRTRSDRSLSISSDDSTVSFSSPSSEDLSKQKRRLTFPSSDVTVKRKRGRPPLNKNRDSSLPTSSKKRPQSSSFDAENRKPPELNLYSKRSRISRGQLYEGNFSLTDESSKVKTRRRSQFRVLSDSLPVNNNFKVKPKAVHRQPEEQSEKKVENLRNDRKSSPRAYRNMSPLKRQVQLRRKSVPSYFSAKRFHCYVLY